MASLLGSRVAAGAAVAARVGEACSEHDNSFMWWEGAAGWLAVRLGTHIIRPAAAVAVAYVERERGQRRGEERLYPL